MRSWKYFVFILGLAFSLMVVALVQLPDKNLHIIVCDVGQGDGILIVYKQIQILTDGGPDSKILNCLGRYMPFWDRQIELVISTHADADHLTGIVETIKRYRVNKLVINPINSGTQLYRLLQTQVGGKGIEVVNPVGGQGLMLDLIYLDILSPSQIDLSLLAQNPIRGNLDKYTVTEKLNSYSISYKLSFKNFSALMLADIPPNVSDELSLNPKTRNVEYIKIPHHGSKNGLTQNLLEISRPKVALISVGKENTWGHPSKEILELLDKYKVKILRTDEVGSIEAVTNGSSFWIK